MNLSTDTTRRIQTHIADLANPDKNVSFQAERRLIRFGPKAVVALLEATKSDNAQVRFRAVWALGKIRDPRAFAAILALTQDADKTVAYDAVLSLGELGDERAIPALTERLRHAAPDDVLASAAAMALGKFGSEAIPPLVDVHKTGGVSGREMADNGLRRMSNMTTHHIYLMAPGASPDDIRRFYGLGLGLEECEKPPSLAHISVLWFDAEPIKFHVGHPTEGTVGGGHTALAVSDMEAVRARVSALGYAVDDNVIPMGYPRFYLRDPWGNQFEILPEGLP